VASEFQRKNVVDFSGILLIWIGFHLLDNLFLFQVDVSSRKQINFLKIVRQI
jgi:hypothetical protein